MQFPTEGRRRDSLFLWPQKRAFSFLFLLLLHLISLRLRRFSPAYACQPRSPPPSFARLLGCLLAIQCFSLSLSWKEAGGGKRCMHKLVVMPPPSSAVRNGPKKQAGEERERESRVEESSSSPQKEEAEEERRRRRRRPHFSFPERPLPPRLQFLLTTTEEEESLFYARGRRFPTKKCCRLESGDNIAALRGKMLPYSPLCSPLSINLSAIFLRITAQAKSGSLRTEKAADVLSTRERSVY